MFSVVLISQFCVECRGCWEGGGSKTSQSRTRLEVCLLTGSRHDLRFELLRYSGADFDNAAQECDRQHPFS